MSASPPTPRRKKLPGKKKPPTLALLRAQIANEADPARAAGVARYFKTGKGEYGEGDRFLGLRSAQMDALARGARGLGLAATLRLLRSPWHEERAVALRILVDAHGRGTAAERLAIERAYLANTRYVNNWDLVDLSAPALVGPRIERGETRLVERLAKSKLLWERRIAMVATLHATRRGDFAPAVTIAERLLDDGHDLMHKAVGWMLREVGKRSPETLRAFLTTHAARMPRTALRYSIERFTPDERGRWLAVRPTPRGRRATRPAAPTA